MELEIEKYDVHLAIAIKHGADLIMKTLEDVDITPKLASRVSVYREALAIHHNRPVKRDLFHAQLQSS